ncbi:MAG: V-type ATP synthase subunit I [Oscillospiraceae bacterium]|jgi:V/A-type H+-transporting ATPase subunit I|nr:V-type ATP synthase subunit I [Oscillospiraceae bacterium]
MAILPIKKINIFAFKEDKEDILKLIQTMGIVQINESNTDFEKEDSSNYKVFFERAVDRLNQALQIIKIYIPKTNLQSNLLNPKRIILPKKRDEIIEEEKEITRLASKIIFSHEEIKQKKADCLQVNSEIESIKPWENLDIHLRFKETKYTRSFIGSLPGALNPQKITKKFSKDLSNIEDIEFEIISADKNQICVFVVCMKEDELKVESCLNDMGFTKPSSDSTKLPPKHEKIKLEKTLCFLKLQIATLKSDILNIAKKLDDFMFLIDLYSNKIEEYNAIGKLSHMHNLFILSGYILQKDCTLLKTTLSNKFCVAVEYEEPRDNENTPIVLSNSYLVSPLESVVESFSLPKKYEVDPTPIMSVFYYVLFGLMLSDAAYGFIISVGCIFALFKFKKSGNSIKQSAKMFFICGLSTMIWGIMFGSYFGDAIDIISDKFFKHKFSIQPLWFFPIKQPMKLLGFSLGLGILHIFTGLAIKLYSLIKQKHYKEAIYDVIFWYFLVGGIVVYSLSSEIVCDMLVLDFKLSSDVANFFGTTAVVGALGILFTSGRESKGLKRILKGIYALYNVTGYISDILSYSRLLALGLATSVISGVFNVMAGMVSDTFLGPVWFLLIFLIGHSLNISINALGAYVHTNRLQFIEFFGKFYEGGGQKFSPFKLNSKYTTLKK